MLHGGLGSGSQAEAAYGWNAKAASAGFVVAYPDGLNRSWAVSPTCCGPSAAAGVDDVAFITKVVTTVSGWLPIDGDRIYATGISNGGMLAYRLACDTTVFAAIGPAAATLSGPCPAPAPISIRHIHGTADTAIPYGGGPGRRDNGGHGRIPLGINGPPIEDLIATWRTTADCSAPTTRTAGVLTTTTATCPHGRAVDLITITGAGHQWPGAAPTGRPAGPFGRDHPTTALTATDTLWAFFTTHPKAS
jgi:polyhydroxybutyrate depolymerase